MKLTDKAVTESTLPRGKSEVIFFDDALPGFGLRLREGGAARWIYQYKIGSQHRRITLGAVSALSAARARETASVLHAKVRLGTDPAGDKVEGRARAAETMGGALETYTAHQRARLKPLSYIQMERHLIKHCRSLHGMQLGKIDRRAVAARLAAIATKSGPIESNRVRASLSAFFAWCIREGLADSNPVVGTGRRPEKSRNRVLDDAELKAIWTATAGDDDYSAIVRLLMLTACRANEIAGLRWSEVSDDKIVLPAARTKNAREHTIPMTGSIRAILDAQPRQPDRDFIFGRRQGRPFTGWAACKGLLDARIKKNDATVEHWTPHDLRRTAATRMAELGVVPHIIEAMLNHVSGHKRGVHGIYNRATYEPEKQRALMLWNERVTAIVGSRKSKVVPLKRA